MEIAGQINNCSFYQTSRAIYVNLEILNTRIVDQQNSEIVELRSLRHGQKITAKFLGEKKEFSEIRKIINTLLNRVALVVVDSLEYPKDPKQSIKYLIKSVDVCELWKEN